MVVNLAAHLGAILLLLLSISVTEAHRPHLDDGTHVSITNAWEWPDTSIARILMTTQECPSLPVYTKITITNVSAPVAVSIGIPNITTLYDYRPSLWFIGKSVIIPETYQTDSDICKHGLLPNATGLQPRVPRGFNAVEYPAEASKLFRGFSESDLISGYAILGANVTVSAPGEVFVVLQPTEHRRARTWLAIGRDETPDPNEVGRASEVDEHAWFSSTSTPLLGSMCVPWGSMQ
ncbi:hypothetical protein RBB50_002458 [Rhinocladiella similis]